MTEPVDVSQIDNLPANVQDMIRAAVAQAIATYHPGEAPPAVPETKQQAAGRLVGQLGAALNAEQAVVSGSGRIHQLTHALLASLVAEVFPDEQPTVVEASPTLAPAPEGAN